MFQGNAMNSTFTPKSQLYLLFLGLARHNEMTELLEACHRKVLLASTLNWP